MTETMREWLLLMAGACFCLFTFLFGVPVVAYYVSRWWAWWTP